MIHNSARTTVNATALANVAKSNENSICQNPGMNPTGLAEIFNKDMLFLRLAQPEVLFWSQKVLTLVRV